MLCNKCEIAPAKDAGLCASCLAGVPHACAGCGAACPVDAKYCPACGAALNIERTAGRSFEYGGEYRSLTVLFCDLCGSSALSTRLDPEDMADLLARYQRAVSTLVLAAGGIVARFLGDGILAYFGYPAAREDDAERAIAAALDIATGMDALSPPGEQLQVRIGIATGMVLVADLNAGPEADRPAIVGDTPNLAARFQALAEPGDVVVGDDTRRIAGDLFAWRDLGPKALKGFATPFRAWLALRRREVESRFEALRPVRLPLVGRSEDLDLLCRRWETAKTGDGQVVLLLGEPGIGKSRLVVALQERLGLKPHAVVRLSCSPQHRQTTLYPSMRQLERAAGFARTDDDATKQTKLRALLQQARLTDPDDIAALAELMGFSSLADTDATQTIRRKIDPQRQRALTLEALMRQFEALSEREPLLAIFEDVHWIDPTSRDLLELAVQRIARKPILTLITARPEFRPAWIAGNHITLILPRRLSRADTAKLIAHRADRHTLDDDVVRTIIDRSDGVPLFVEELTLAYMADRGDGRPGGSGGTAEILLPTSLQALLIERLDRAGHGKELAQIGAVLGREFDQDVLLAVCGQGAAEFEDAMARLIAEGLIVRHANGPRGTFAFRHALIQDAAYAGLLRTKRQHVHARVADTLIEAFPNLVTRQPETLAHHLSAAGRLLEAATYWLLAGRRAVERWAIAEAVAHLEKGIAAARQLAPSAERDRLEFELLTVLGPALMAQKGYASDEGLAIFQRARGLMNDMGTLAERLHVLHGLFDVHFGRGELINALSVAQVADEIVVPSQRGLPSAIGQTLCSMGRFVEARDHLQRAIDTIDQSTDEPSGLFGSHYVVAVSFMAKVSFALGFPDQSARWTDAAIQHATASGHPVSIAIALMGGMFLATEHGDVRRAIGLTDKALAQARDHGLGNFELWARFHRAALDIRHDPRAAIVAMQDVLDEAERVGTRMFRPAQLGYLGAAHASIGQFEPALGLFDEGLALADATEAREAVPALHRLKARTLLAVGQKEAGEASLSDAIYFANCQSARIEELRSAVTLARIRYDQSRPDEARDVLAGVLDGFTEGHEFADIKHARKLFSRLNEWCDRRIFV